MCVFVSCACTDGTRPQGLPSFLLFLDLDLQIVETVMCTKSIR